MLDQSPKADRKLGEGGVIELTVSSGQKAFQLIDYSNLEYRQVETELQRLGLLFRETHEQSDTVLKDYVIRGHAYQAIFNRRLERGQSYATLSLGWSEFTPSYFGPIRKTTQVCEELADIHIPSMLRGVFQNGYRSAFQAVYDTDLCIHKGVLAYPERGDCR